MKLNAFLDPDEADKAHFDGQTTAADFVAAAAIFDPLSTSSTFARKCCKVEAPLATKKGKGMVIEFVQTLVKHCQTCRAEETERSKNSALLKNQQNEITKLWPGPGLQHCNCTFFFDAPLFQPTTFQNCIL